MSESVREWTHKQRDYQLFRALPDEVKADFDLPLTEKAMAERLDVNARTLYRWRQIEGWQDAVNDLARQHLKDDLPEAFAALRREAKRGSFPHLKAYLEMTGDYRPPVSRVAQTDSEGNDVAGDDDLIKAAATIIARRAKDA